MPRTPVYVLPGNPKSLLSQIFDKPKTTESKKAPAKAKAAKKSGP